jgi:adenosylcobinamide-phosphate synthase
MRFDHQVLAALGVDLVLGDPRWLPHPVRLIGCLAAGMESPARQCLPARAAGIAVALTVIGLTGASTWLLLRGARVVHPIAEDLAAVLLLWTTLAARDLAGHAAAVYWALSSGDLPAARRCVARMVGRDTEDLDETGVVRAAVESVAENTVDGVTAPLFFACLFGPCGAMVYKAINTLDSTFGYKNERYLQFGWASARIDDAANFLPARLTVPLVSVAAALMRLRPLGAIHVLLRDGYKHPSPNSGLIEAAVAGALGVQLGGPISYSGQPSLKATLGDPHSPLVRQHILQAIRLMLVTSVAATALFLGLRWAALVGWRLA